MRPTIAASLLLLAACTSPSPQPTVVVPSATPAATQAPSEEGPQALVWTAGTNDRPGSTRWLAPTASGYRQVGEAPGIVLASGPDVWRWSAKEEPVKTEPCEGSLARPPGKGTVTRVVLEKVGTKETVEVVPPKKIDRSVNTVAHTVTPMGSIGPYLFVRERTEVYACAAHRTYEVEQSTWDLSRRARVELLSPEERKAVDTADRPAALRLFNAKQGAESVSADDISYVASVPHYQARGFLTVEHLFTASTSNAGSDGVWSSATRSVLVPAAKVPEKAQPFVKPPPAVAAYLTEHPGEKIAGWSAVSKEAAAVLGTAMGAH